MVLRIIQRGGKGFSQNLRSLPNERDAGHVREREIGNDQHPEGIEVFEKSSTDLSDQDTRSADWSS